MRIALVSDWTAPRLGGIEGQVNGLAAQLRERGHAVSVITVTPGPDALNGVIARRRCATSRRAARPSEP